MFLRQLFYSHYFLGQKHDSNIASVLTEKEKQIMIHKTTDYQTNQNGGGHPNIQMAEKGSGDIPPPPKMPGKGSGDIPPPPPRPK